LNAARSLSASSATRMLLAVHSNWPAIELDKASEPRDGCVYMQDPRDAQLCTAHCTLPSAGCMWKRGRCGSCSYPLGKAIHCHADKHSTLCSRQSALLNGTWDERDCRVLKGETRFFQCRLCHAKATSQILWTTLLRQTCAHVSINVCSSNLETGRRQLLPPIKH